MVCFLKQRNLEGHNSNNIPQLESFGESAWTFILAIFKAGWDQLLSSNGITIRDNIAANFGKINHPTMRVTRVDSRRFLRELDEAPEGNNLQYILK